MSLNSHAGCTKSRQDDLESLGYVLVDLLYPSMLHKGLKQTGSNSLIDAKKNLVQNMKNAMMQMENKISKTVNEKEQ